MYLSPWRHLRSWARVCLQDVRRVCADMDKGDQKQVGMGVGVLTVVPNGDSPRWSAIIQVDSVNCTAGVDFNDSCTFACVWSKIEFQVSAPGGTLAAARHAC